MLAARYDRAGAAADVLRVEEIPRPEPGPGEVRVRVAVSGVNPTDWKQRTGLTMKVDGARVPHQDGAGTIDAVGPGVDAARIGERVWVYLAVARRIWGTAAQWSVVPQERAVALPHDVSFDLGASIGVPALTAYHCLLADGPIDGRNILVAGGAGAVGHAAIQLARYAGAHVIATASNEQKRALARDAGAELVVDYRADDAPQQIRAAAPDGVDRIVEVALPANLELDLAVCRPNAVINVYADTGPGELTVPIRRLMNANVALRFVLLYGIGADKLAAAVAGVSKALAAGALTPLPLHRFGLDQIAEAHDAVESGAVGKVLVDIP
jgi:NADPH2:quinone reductase